MENVNVSFINESSDSCIIRHEENTNCVPKAQFMDTMNEINKAKDIKNMFLFKKGQKYSFNLKFEDKTGMKIKNVGKNDPYFNTLKEMSNIKVYNFHKVGLILATATIVTVSGIAIFSQEPVQKFVSEVGQDIVSTFEVFNEKQQMQNDFEIMRIYSMQLHPDRYDEDLYYEFRGLVEKYNNIDTIELLNISEHDVELLEKYDQQLSDYYYESRKYIDFSSQGKVY